jgi:arylsulfatase A-like enzyme
MSRTRTCHRIRLRSLIGVVAVSLAATSAIDTGAAPADERPNILFALADDWAWPHAGVYGDKVVKTPTFDAVAADGMLFSHAFCVAPSCTPSRAAILTGQASHRLEESGNLWSILRKKYDCYPDLLEAAGYHVGFTRKGWGPGSLDGSGRTRNPAGPFYKDFATFLHSVPAGKPFCFWFGSHDPHRPYVKGSGVSSGMRLEDVFVPPYLPDSPEVRSDICDYYFAVQRYDREVGTILKLIEAAGKLNNTMVVMTGDNGWPFPRAKANLYDAGTRQPLAVRWPARVKPGRKSDAFISFQDLAPTFLQAAGLEPAAAMTGHSFLDLLTGTSTVGRDRVFLERERHANVRRGNLGYPCRAVRTREFLYIRNFHPERWPAGDPQMWKAVGPFGDIDGGPSKELVLKGLDDNVLGRFFQLACGKRPHEELYDVRQDPYELTNLADRPEYAQTKRTLTKSLDEWMRTTNDPRASATDDRWDRYPYFGSEPKRKSDVK